MDSKAIQKQIGEFIFRVNKEMKIEKIILYGSSLQKNVAPHDIDLIVVGNFPQEDTESFLYDLYTDIPRTIDFHVYGIHAKDKSVSPFLSQALSEGRVIYSSSGSVPL
ncbi:MAG: hypothetical protein Q8P72_04500 [Candidatus Roizmanbacteria bacterium]|nr:hypothetical protein [Candidatus Roizmanbacteria bacterium]